jgi:transposase
MGKAYSIDLRQRLVREVESGESRRAAAERFEVAPSTAVRLCAWYEESGSVEPKKQGRPRGSGKLGSHRDFIIDQVKREPDITMPEIAARLEAERGVKVDPSNVSKLLCAAGWTYKKSASGLGARTQRR